MNQKIENRGDILLKKWLEGSITWQEERELEQLAKGDAMLIDALAGYRTMPESNHAKQVERLQARLQERAGRKQRGLIFYLSRVAAAAAIVGALSVGIWFLNQEAGAKYEVQITKPENPQLESVPLQPSIADVQAADTNVALALEERATTLVNPGQEDSPLIQPRVRRTDGVVVETEVDTNLDIADVTLPTITEETRPDLAAKKAEAAPPVPQTFERAQSPVTTRAFTAPSGRVVTGKVTDASGEPLIGASVVVPGTNQGTVSDADGSFKIEVPPGKEQLAINYTGFTSQEVQLGVMNQVQIQMQADSQSLSEVVVSGYAVERKQNQARKQDIESKKAEALQGKTSGVQVTRLPAPRGGFDRLERYIRNNLRYPKTAKDAKIEGKVRVEFTILSNGSLTDFKVMESLGYGLDEEAIRLLKEGPKWDVRNKELQRDAGSYTIEFKLKK